MKQNSESTMADYPVHGHNKNPPDRFYYFFTMITGIHGRDPGQEMATDTNPQRGAESRRLRDLKKQSFGHKPQPAQPPGTMPAKERASSIQWSVRSTCRRCAAAWR